VERGEALRRAAQQSALSGSAELPAIGGGQESMGIGRPAGVVKGYAGNLAASFLFPTSLNNLIISLIMWILLCLLQFILPHGGILGWLGSLVVLGYYCAFRLNVIAKAASGDDDLPEISLAEGAMEDIVIPLYKWIGSWAVALGPAAVYLIVIAAGGVNVPSVEDMLLGGISGLLQQASGELAVFVVLVFAGLFLWPIIVLCVELGGFSSLVRPDLILVTIIRTLPAYALTVAMVFGATILIAFLDKFFAGAKEMALKPLLILTMGFYLEVVTMRFIGLYYHHFKQRFAWDWG